MSHARKYVMRQVHIHWYKSVIGWNLTHEHRLSEWTTLSARNVYEKDNLCNRCSVRVITARTDTCWYNWGSWAFSSVIPAERCRWHMFSSFPVKLQGGGIDTNGWLDQYCRLLVVPAERCWSYWALSFRFFNSIPKIHIRDFVQWIYEQSNNKYVSSM